MYGSGPVQGYFSKDNVDLAGLTVEGQEFAEVTDASGLGPAFKVRAYVRNIVVHTDLTGGGFSVQRSVHACVPVRRRPVRF